MNCEEHSEFSARALKTGLPPWARLISRAASGPEQERDEKGNYKISLEKLASQKIEAFTPEQRAELDRISAEDELEAQSFLKWAFRSFVQVKSGILEESETGDQVAVKDGIDLLRLYGARNDVISEVLSAIRLENELEASEKKSWKSRSGSSISSSAPGPDPDGPKLETIASSAETEDSIEIEDATPAPAPEDELEKTPARLYGSTEISPSDSARSSP